MIHGTVKDQVKVGGGIVGVRGASYEIDGVSILDQVSLEVRAGEVLAIVGPNGAGKSTLLGLLAGDLRPTSGAVTWADGRDLHTVRLGELARGRAVVTQEVRIAFAFRVEEIVRMGREPWRGTCQEDDDAATCAWAMRVCAVDTLASRRYPTLSGGEKGRVALARALAQTPVAYLLDEPTAALDIHHQERALAQVRALAGGGAGVGIVVHDLTLAAAYADRVAVLDSGRLVCVDSPERALTRELLSAVYQHPIDVITHPRTGALVVLPERDGVRGAEVLT